MSGLEPAVRLIAAREIRERTRGRAFRITTVVLIAVGIAAVAIPAATAGRPAPRVDVGLVGTYSQPLQDTIASVGATVGVTVRLRPQPDEAAARAALRRGALDVAVIDGERLLVDRQIDQQTSALGRLTAALSRAVGLARSLERAGLSPEEAERALHAPPLPVATVERAEPDLGARKAIAYLGLLLLYIALVTYGGWVAVGVLEEKSSRIVELLLATVRPSKLLAGKVLGIGACGLMQFGAITGAALATSLAVNSDALPTGAPLAIAGALVWFVLGFAFYSCLYAAAGSLGSKIQDAQAILAPMNILLLAVYLFGTLSALNDPDAPLIKVMSFFPPTAPLTMPVRSIVGQVPWWQIGISMALTVAGAVFLIRVAGRVYANAILRTGPRIRFRQAWREARERGPAAADAPGA